MAKFKIILSDPETGKSKLLDLEATRAVPLVGRKLGEIIDGAAIGLGGHKIQITGGSDKDGFPMRPDIHGGVITQVILTNSVGFHSKNKGERRRKTVRGRVITEDIVQVNMKIVEKPTKSKKPEKPESTEKKPEKTEKREDRKQGNNEKEKQETQKKEKTRKSKELKEEQKPEQ